MAERANASDGRGHSERRMVYRGECVKVQSTQEHYECLLKEAGEIAREIYSKIIEGDRRTKKEQFALEKAIVIMRLAQKNT